jgi:hypothetical protein
MENGVAKPFIRISINTRCDTTQWTFGKALLQTLIHTHHKLTPEFISNDEGKSIPFTGVEDCRNFWAPLAQVRTAHMPTFEFPLSFFWSRLREVKGKGNVAHACFPRQGTTPTLGKVTLEQAPSPKIAWRQLFEALCAISDPFFGMLHLFTKDELGYAPFDSPESDFRGGPVGVVIRRGIPELPWGAFLSDEQKVIANWEELLRDGFEVVRVAGGTFLFLTNDMFEIERSFRGFQLRREEAKAHFDRGSFITTGTAPSRS